MKLLASSYDSAGKWNIPIGILCFILVSVLSCERWDLELQNVPEIKSIQVIVGNNPTELTIEGAISGILKENFVEQYGHVWSLSQQLLPSLDDNIGKTVLQNSGNGNFRSEVNGLTPGLTYFYRAYLVIDNEVIYENEVKQLNTQPLPVHLEITSIVQPSGSQRATVAATISGLPQGLPVSSYGLTWSSQIAPDINNDPFEAEQGIITASSAISFEKEIPLFLNKVYFRPYLTVAGKTFYGEARSFQLEDVWFKRSDVPGNDKSGAFGFSIGTKGYVGGGEEPDFWEYDPDKDTWTRKADFPGETPRLGAVSFVIQGKAYVGTGSMLGCFCPYRTKYEDLWEYDPNEDTWTRKADFPGGPRHHAAGFAINGKGYLGTGVDFFGDAQNDFWEYDPPTDSWKEVASFEGIARYGAATFTIGNKGYLGIGIIDGSIRRRDFWEYAPSDDSWTRKANFVEQGRACTVSFSIGDKGYIGTGCDNTSDRNNDLWEFDPTTNVWTKKTNFTGRARQEATGFSIGNRGYIGSGLGVTDFWVYLAE
ncbi:Kelch repeat-containing protein [Flavilitoribacter nigricans]|uniref:Galactose oxidase n=1 Tax=Flavilitoribacter nigricans (strain ATCC 23147 / DSM 23189 / NBRC 102662 / NCIMB 1420 / SS-2) TaxID=1122177 RepID=A0A2D0MXF6_FLAN2|nr:kelch repeat-containing protein [Flavilitoribacter nigricans]PHN00887.1 hypothetical protein CRP01_39805 [Flavilitoribacter nigricans DSM 23189 = NBRC 102662]